MFDKNKIALTILFSLLFYGISAQTMKKEIASKQKEFMEKNVCTTEFKTLDLNC